MVAVLPLQMSPISSLSLPNQPSGNSGSESISASSWLATWVRRCSWVSLRFSEQLHARPSSSTQSLLSVPRKNTAAGVAVGVDAVVLLLRLTCWLPSVLMRQSLWSVPWK